MEKNVNTLPTGTLEGLSECTTGGVAGEIETAGGLAAIILAASAQRGDFAAAGLRPELSAIEGFRTSWCRPRFLKLLNKKQC